jgi:hypothetical protein
MLHIMVERFDPDLERAVLLQRLLVALTADRIRGALAPDRAATVRRLGDDLFVGEGKLSVSVATLSPVSALIHLGLNIDDRGTPVRAAALGPLGIDPARLAADLLGDLAGELAGAAAALAKVAPAHPGGAAD